jgi:hypothetical protein
VVTRKGRSESAERTLKQVENRLSELFLDTIDLSDVTKRTEADQKINFLTRGLAALPLLENPGLSSAAAGACITDGDTDDGIDAIYVHEPSSTIYLVQSKWQSNTDRGIAQSDFTKFRDGVLAITRSEWNIDNKNLHRFRSAIENALKEVECKFVMIFVCTTTTRISPSLNAKIAKFLSEQNEFFSEFITFHAVDLAKIAALARSLSRPENINVDAMLSQWGRIREPYKAVYGNISAVDVATWLQDYGNRIFAENLRYPLDRSNVNDQIVKTATETPENFWYFNNGVTAVCDSFAKKAVGGNTNDSGIFSIRRISIINGAQTIGALGRAQKSGADLTNVRLQLRIISLEGTPEGFVYGVTGANNTQNDINRMDFVAHDPNQARIQREAAQLGFSYVYKRGDKDPERTSGFSFRDAAIAAACASGELQNAVVAKRYVTGLWEDITRTPYTSLFSPKTSAKYLWSVTRLLILVDDKVAQSQIALDGRDRLILIHSNRFFLFCMFEAMRIAKLNLSEQLPACEAVVERLFDKLKDAIIKEVNSKFPDAYPGNVFKNYDRQNEIYLEIVNRGLLTMPSRLSQGRRPMLRTSLRASNEK